MEGNPPKRKTAPYKQHHLTGAFHHGPNPPNTDPLWNDTLEWEYEDDEIVFLRLLIKSDDAFAANPKFAVAAVRLLYVVRNEWVFVRMLSLKGQETKCSVLVKFEIEDA
jgi:phosphatidylinositol phospholipase C delta